MVISTADIKYNFKFTQTNIGYSYATAKRVWDGTYVDDFVRYYAFSPSTVATLTNQTHFSSAIAMWDLYTALTFGKDDASPELVVYHANTSNPPTPNDGTSPAGKMNWFDRTPTLDYSRAEIAIDESVNVSRSSGYYAALHEIGHALGLKGDSELGENVTANMTVMSYNIVAGHYPITPMALDIKAIEEKYGATIYRSGADTYRYDSTVQGGAGTFTGANRSQTIMDTGGVDWFDTRAYTGDVVLNLNRAVDANGHWIGNETNDHVSIVGDELIYIAHNTTIENARSGSGNDVLYGNNSANELLGGAGADNISGNGGNDVLDGITGESGSDSVIGDFMYGGADNDVFLLGRSDYAHDNMGNDTYRIQLDWALGKESSRNYLIRIDDIDGIATLYINNNPVSGIAKPLVHNDSIDRTIWTLGNYYLHAYDLGSNSSIIKISPMIDRTGSRASLINPIDLIAQTRNKTRFGITLSSDIVGTSGADNLSGDTSSQRIEGGAGNDTISGSGGNDSLYGGAGADSIRGGSGLDSYYYTLGEGQDTIADQGLANEADIVRIAGINSSQATYTRIGTSNDVRIGFANNATDSILLSRALEVGNHNAICEILMKVASVFYKHITMQSSLCYA